MSSRAPEAFLRVRRDDPEYLRQAAAEAAYWQNVHPGGLEAMENRFSSGPVDRYFNRHFTGNADVSWYETIHRRGSFRRGAVLGTSSLTVEERILATNPSLHATFIDISPGALEHRVEAFGKRYAARMTTEVADLNFIDFPSGSYDLIVSSSAIHHVINLEHLAHQINRALTPDGLFFLDDYVGEPRFRFSTEKKNVYEQVFNRDRIRQGLAPAGLVWLDSSDLSPFCGVRSDEILEVLSTTLEVVELHRAGTLLNPLLRSRPAEDVAKSPWVTDSWVLDQPRHLYYLRRLQNRFPRIFGRLPPMQSLIDPRLLDELFLIGDVLADASLLLPAQAFAIFRKRQVLAA